MRYNSELVVNLDLLAHNYQLLKKLTKNNETIFMVKADAYGHGIKEIVYYAFNELKISRFGVASLGEAMNIRESLPTLNCEIWVFSDTELDSEKYKEYYLDYNIIPVIHDLSDLQNILDDKDYARMPIVIKIDTGMYRLGISESDIEKMIFLIKESGRSSIHHLCTHFSGSYIKLKNGDKTSRQYEKFLKIKEMLHDSGISIEESSCANSGAIEQGFSLDESHVRPGLMLYGPSSTISSFSQWQGKTISSFKTKIMKVIEVKKGMPIGYGGHVCGKDGYVAYVPVGYGDGILTYYSGLKHKYLGEDYQILGRINMDLTAIFFENRPPELKRGSEFFFWDSTNNNIAEFSAQLKTIPYQLFTGITSRVPRRYIN